MLDRADTAAVGPPRSVRRRRVPTMLQMEAVECGAAALGMILAYHGHWLPLETLREAVAMAKGRAITEASGGINPKTAGAIAATGVDLLSMGWLTHSAPGLDVALDVG